MLTIFFIWSAIFANRSMVFGYSQAMMLSYVLGGAIITAFVLSSRSYAMGDDINSGDLSNYLLKPLNFTLYYFFVDLGDKAMNVFFSIAEVIILFLVFKPPVFLQTNLYHLLFFIIALILAILLSFFFNVVLGFFAFWIPEVWGLRFIFNIILSFFAGVYFPIDILPKAIANTFGLLPFQYILYFPLKIYLGQLTGMEILRGIIISFSWLIILYLFANFLWKKGLEAYTAYGR